MRLFFFLSSPFSFFFSFLSYLVLLIWLVSVSFRRDSRSPQLWRFLKHVLHFCSIETSTRLLHFSTLHHGHILIRFVSSCAGILNHPHNIHSVNDLTKDHVLVVQERSRRCCYKKLTAICIWTRILETDQCLPEEGTAKLTAMLNRPPRSCLKAKFSSGNFEVP